MSLSFQKKQRLSLETAVCGLALMVLAGCSVGPNYKRPPVTQPKTFRGQEEPATNSFADLPWWQVFHDDTLQTLVRTALTNNFDVRIAVTRVEQARAAVAEARAGYYPQVDYNGSIGGGRNIGANNTPSPSGITGKATALYLGATWEIDLWGRVRRLSESAKAQFFASEEARHDVLISVIGQVAESYFQLKALDDQLKIARDTTNSFGQSFTIFSQRLQGGIASKLETSSADALLHSAAASIPDLERQIVLAEDQLSILLGQDAGPILRGGSTLQNELPPEIPPGLPSALLERRPDIREAEQQLRSANAQVGVAVANFFPQIDLTGLFGAVSPSLNIFTSGGAAAWGVGAGLTGPLFEGGLLHARYLEAKAARDQTAAQYQFAVLNAFREVSDALVSHQKLAVERAERARAVEAYKEAVDVAMKRYKSGNASYYEVLQEQQLLFPAEDSLVQTELSQVLAVVDLYRALGGGWQQQQ